MPLRGSFKTMSLGEVLEWVDRKKKTGSLQLLRGEIAKDIFLEQGKVISSGSNDPREYLGQFFISFGKITEEDFVKAFQIQKETGVLFGKIMVMIGKATEAQVQKVLLHKTRETLLDCFLWEEGTFAFEDDAKVTTNIRIPLEVELSNIVVEGQARLEEWKQITQKIPNPDTTIVPEPKNYPEGFPNRPDEIKLIQLLEKNRKIPEICYEFHMSEFLVTKKLFQLLEKGILKTEGTLTKPPVTAARPPAGAAGNLDSDILPIASVSEPAAPKAAQLPKEKILESVQLFKEGKGLYKEGKLEQAVKVFQALLEATPDNEMARKYYNEANQKLIAELSTNLSVDKVPKLKADLNSLDSKSFNHEEGYALSRINGQWTLGEIMQICPFPKEKVLTAFKRFLKEGIISL